MTTAPYQLRWDDDYLVHESNTPQIKRFQPEPASTSVIELANEEKENIYTILKRILPYDLEEIAEKNEARRKLRFLKQEATDRTAGMSSAPDSESDIQRASAEMDYFSKLQSEFINREVEIEE